MAVLIIRNTMLDVNELTLHVKLITKIEDLLGYKTYVFQDLDQESTDYKYIMCTEFPNWDSYHPDINQEGFVNVRYIQAGVDQWFDGHSFKTYRYSNIQFLKFIPQTLPEDSSLVLD